MALGLPVLGLATTEMATAVQNGVNGYVETRPDRLVTHARRLLQDPVEAAELSVGAVTTARERFGHQRFVQDWSDVLHRAAARTSDEVSSSSPGSGSGASSSFT
jgi:glycosyltransferase involved in cell wall biosynthesis